MKINLKFLILTYIFANTIFAQQSVSINGASIVEVGIPYNYSFQFSPVYPTVDLVTADSYVITEWIVSTNTNSQTSGIPGYIFSPTNQSNYYNNSTFNSPGTISVPIQWGDGGSVVLNYDVITVKVSGYYKKNSTGANLGYFSYLTATKNVTIERLNAPIINGPSPIDSCSDANQTYSFSNATNSNLRLWTVSGGATIIESNTGTSVVVKPPLVGNFSVECEVKRSSANSNYKKYGGKSVTRKPYVTSASISGIYNFCNTGNYTVNGLIAGETVLSWSTSNSSIAITNNSFGNTTTVEKVSEGSVTLIATIANSCGQTATTTKTILIGRPLPDNYTITGGGATAPINSTTQLSVSYVNGATSYKWTVNSLSSGCVDANGIPVGGVTLPKFSNGSNTITTVSPIAFVNWGSCPSDVVVNCSAINSCGEKGVGYKVVSVYNYGGGGGGEDPCQGKMTVSPNPVKDDIFVVNIALPPVDPCGPVLLDRTGIKNKVTIYDLQGNKVFSKEYDSDKISISNLNLRKGHYVIHADSNNGKNHKSIIVVE